MKRIIAVLMTMCLLLPLVACSQEKASGSGSQDASSPEEQTISGVVNKTDDYLVLLTDDGEYHIFDFGEDVDPSAMEEGDRVTVTYTGTLDSEDPSPVAIAVQPSDA